MSQEQNPLYGLSSARCTPDFAIYSCSWRTNGGLALEIYYILPSGSSNGSGASIGDTNTICTSECTTQQEMIAQFSQNDPSVTFLGMYVEDGF